MWTSMFSFSGLVDKEEKDMQTSPTGLTRELLEVKIRQQLVVVQVIFVKWYLWLSMLPAGVSVYFPKR